MNKKVKEWWKQYRKIILPSYYWTHQTEVTTTMNNKPERSYLDVEDALKTPAGRITAIILIEAYLAMLEPEERLAIFQRASHIDALVTSSQEREAHD